MLAQLIFKPAISDFQAARNCPTRVSFSIFESVFLHHHPMAFVSTLLTVIRAFYVINGKYDEVMCVRHIPSPSIRAFFLFISTCVQRFFGIICFFFFLSSFLFFLFVSILFRLKKKTTTMQTFS